MRLYERAIMLAVITYVIRRTETNPKLCSIVASLTPPFLYVSGTQPIGACMRNPPVQERQNFSLPIVSLLRCTVLQPVCTSRDMGDEDEEGQERLHLAS